MPVEQTEQLPTYGRFYMHSTLKGDPEPKPDNKPEYQDVLMCEIAIKGDKNTSISKPVYQAGTEKPIEHPGLGDLTQIYPRAWAAYQNDSDDFMEGTPLDVLPGIGISAKRNLQADGILSVEDLAGLPDSIALGQSGMVDLRKKAQAYMNVIEPEKEAAAKQSMLDEMAAMKAQIEELTATKRTRRTRNEAGELE